MPRFVILFHELPADADRTSHWDLMLEDGPALRTWALAAEPRLDRPISAFALPDHRLAYLEYQGPVSGGRGHVTQWDRGELEWRVHEATEVCVRLHGQRLRAEARLTGDPSSQRWLFVASAAVDSANRD